MSVCEYHELIEVTFEAVEDAPLQNEANSTLPASRLVIANRGSALHLIPTTPRLKWDETSASGARVLGEVVVLKRALHSPFNVVNISLLLGDLLRGEANAKQEEAKHFQHNYEV